MQLFLDTTDIGLLKEFTATGLVDGVTTNPSLIAKSGRNIAEVIAEICALVEGPISAEAVSLDCDTMIREGEKLAGIAPWPAGQRVISTDLATVPRQQAAVERFARARLRQSGRDADRAARRPSAVGEMERTDSPMKTTP